MNTNPEHTKWLLSAIVAIMSPIVNICMQVFITGVIFYARSEIRPENSKSSKRNREGETPVDNSMRSSASSLNESMNFNAQDDVAEKLD